MFLYLEAQERFEREFSSTFITDSLVLVSGFILFSNFIKTYHVLSSSEPQSVIVYNFRTLLIFIFRLNIRNELDSIYNIYFRVYR